MSKRGIYPDYMDSFDNFNKKELSAKRRIFSILNKKPVSDKDCKHAKKVWKTSQLVFAHW